MKQFITPFYIFVPGATGVGYIDLKSIQNFDVKRLVAIINQTQGKIIYSAASEAFKYLAVTGSQLYFNVDTSGQSASDDIQIIYDAESSTVDMIVMLNNLLSIIANPGIRDKSVNADRVSVVNTVPVTVSSGTVTNLLALAGYQAQIPVQNNNLAAWSLTRRNTIS
jgi:hypothetical protein